MHNGYIKLWRKSFESSVWADPNLWRTWCCCLLLANHKDGWVKVIGLAEPVKVEPGQFITGRYEFHKHMFPKKKKSNPNPRTSWRWMQTLKNMRNLSIETSNRYSLVSIVNWDIYQNEMSSQMSNRCPADVQPVSTNKNDKKVKNDKKEYGQFHNVKLTDVEYQKLEEKFNNHLPAMIENLSEYIASKGKKYSSHYATILMWSRKNDIDPSTPKPPAIQYKNDAFFEEPN